MYWRACCMCFPKTVQTWAVLLRSLMRSGWEMTPWFKILTELRSMPLAQLDEFRVTVQDLLEAGVKRESNSPYALPVMLVQKDGGLRASADFRKLNAKSHKGRDTRCEKSLGHVATTGCCNKSPRVTCENHCRCDLSHKFKLVCICATYRSDKTRASDLLQQQCRRVAVICPIASWP